MRQHSQPVLLLPLFAPFVSWPKTKGYQKLTAQGNNIPAINFNSTLQNE
jgi:hypothetical protein